MVLEKTDLALVGKEGHLRAGQSGISEKAYYIRKKAYYNPRQVALLLEN